MHDNEFVIALAFLDFARGCILKKLDGLDDTSARRVLVPSGTNLLGLVRHLAMSERYWIHHHVGGEPLTAPADETFFSMNVEPGRTMGEVLDDYRTATARSNEIIRRVGDLETPTVEPVDGELLPLRWVLAHLTTETTRHAGHADILRELIDGTTGR